MKVKKMKENNKISLLAAILINLNTMLGAGIFINPSPLTQIAGSLGFLSYLISFIVLFPIVLSLAELAKIHPTSGGLYVYSKKYINPFVGFISGWGYFLGKTVSPALLTHLFVSFLQNRITILQGTPILLLDFFVIFFLMILNIIGVQIGGKVQFLFVAFKIIPILIVIFSGILFFNFNFFTLSLPTFEGILSTIPIGIFALMSFEMICSIGHLLDNPDKNIKRAILGSFIIAITTTTIFQLMIYSVSGDTLITSTEPLQAFAKTIFYNFPTLAKLLSLIVFGSIIGGAYCSFSTNCWNFYTLAKNKHFPFSEKLTKVNKKGFPWVSLLIQGGIACLFLLISKQQIPLQNMAVFGVVSAYMFSSIAAFNAPIKNFFNSKLISIWAMISGSYVIWICLKKLYFYGISIPFFTIFMIGVVIAFFLQRKIKN